METVSGEGGPFTAYDPLKYPRVCRMRNLLGPEPLKPLVDFRDCNLNVFHADCSPDGKYYVIEGQGGAPDRAIRIAKLYEGATGKPLGLLPDQKPVGFGGAGFQFDPQGKGLHYLSREARREDPVCKSVLLEIPSLAVVRHIDDNPGPLGPQGKRWASFEYPTTNHPGGFSYFVESNPDRRVTFIHDKNDLVVNSLRFSSDGLGLMWSTTDGSLTVVNLVEVQNRLAEFGLGW